MFMLLQSTLAAIRAALCDAIDTEALRQQRLATPEVSIPSDLLAAGLWLTAQGCDDQPCSGEIFFAWGPTAYRRYLDRLAPEQREWELAAGHRAIFDRRGRRPPLLEGSTRLVNGFVGDVI